MIEKLLQVLYVFLNCLTVLFGIAISSTGSLPALGALCWGW